MNDEPAEQTPQRWRLPTAGGDYVVEVAPGDAALVWHSWDSVAAGPSSCDRHFMGVADLLPLEATSLGTRNVHGAEIVVRRSDGLRGARLTVAGEIRLAQRDGESHLSCPLADHAVGLRVELHIRTRHDQRVVEKWVQVHNDSDYELQFSRLWGGAFTVPVDSEATIELLAGQWCQEFTPFQVRLPAGTLSIGSRQGITSHTYSPVITVDAGPDETGHDGERELFSVALSWSGSWRMSTDAVPLSGVLRIAGGSDDESATISLAPGQQLRTPTLTGLHTRGDADDVAHAWHTYQRTLSRDEPGSPAAIRRRPVLYNSWYATGFDVRADHQLALADRAAQLGVEAFVVDDGWFTGRTSSAAGLGDWQVDSGKFPAGLEQLIDGVTARGMRFGIWIEPEMVNPDSDLHRAHPQWVHHSRGRPLGTIRNQYVLNLGLPEVEDWVAHTLRSLLSRYDIGYLKWDMNRSIADGGPGRGGHDWSWRHTQAYYRLLDLLRAEFPDVTLEACAGGGGRIDNEVLARSDVVWTSDETGPRDRLAIQHGFLSAYPSWVMSSWVTDAEDRLDTEAASAEFRFVVAMAGVLGIGADLLTWADSDMDRAARFIARYRDIRHVIHGGRIRRHGSPAGQMYAVQCTTEECVVVLAWRRGGSDGEGRLALRDLGPGRFAARGGDQVFDADELTGAGLPVGWTWRDCDVIVLDRVP